MMTMNKTQINDINVYRFFNQSVWDFKEYPDEEVAAYFKRKTSVMDLTDIRNTQLFIDIRDIFTCIFTNKEPYPYTSKCFLNMMRIPAFMLSYGYADFSSIGDIDTIDLKWQEFLTNNGYGGVRDSRSVISKCYFTLVEFRDTRTGLDRNIWRLEDMSLNEERLNQSAYSLRMNFWVINNAHNRELVKAYCRYIIGSTELAYSTIYGTFKFLTMFLSALDEKDIEAITHDDIIKFREKRSSFVEENNRILKKVSAFYRYLITKQLIQCVDPVQKSDFAIFVRKHHNNTVPEYTILETFKHLHTLKEDYKLIYLINLFTGIRISDICQLKTDCLYTNEHGYFLAHDVQKMQDVGGIPICKELYELIQKRIAYVNTIDNGNNYLFLASNDNSKPCIAATYRNYMKRTVKEWGITLPNNEPYNFLTHSFRHTIATQLFKMGMPSALIQIGVLHHVEINMSRSYIDNDADMELELLNKRGINAKSDKTDEISESDAALPNGYCHMPANIKCPNLSACLNCEYFRTSINFLDVHEQQLENVKQQIEYYKENGYEQNLAFAEDEKAKLEVIIAKLKEIKGDESDGTDINQTSGNTTV